MLQEKLNFFDYLFKLELIDFGQSKLFLLIWLSLNRNSLKFNIIVHIKTRKRNFVYPLNISKSISLFFRPISKLPLYFYISICLICCFILK